MESQETRLAIACMVMITLTALIVPATGGQHTSWFPTRNGDWMMDMNISDASSGSFCGERDNDWAGASISSAGDVNGDGIDDILIGSSSNDEGASGAGQTYLIFGKASDWTMDINLSNADASFIGEETGDASGVSVSGAGDVNGDGYDDILIGADMSM
ncbi:MAG: integrin alpha, partial [Candidatus Thermoplasmatota archaeon]|nr:integrin alpha [Candidatus Thermoplasmatota archaeon]